MAKSYPPEIEDAFRKIKGKTSYGWHIYHAFQDEELREELRDLIKQYGIKSGKNISSQGLSDEEFAAFSYHLDVLGEKYAILPHLIGLYITGGPKLILITAQKGSRGGSVGYLADRKQIVLTLHEDTPKDQVIRMWQNAQKIRRMGGKSVKVPKRKPPLYTELVYAVVKARQQNIPYSNIFELYDQKKLKGCEGTRPGGFLTKEELADYYYRFKPQILLKDMKHTHSFLPPFMGDT